MSDSLPTVGVEALNAVIAPRPAKVVAERQPARVLGRVLLPELEVIADEASRELGVAFGAQDEASCQAWVETLATGARVLHIAALPAVGMRSFLSRFTQRASDVSSIDDVCTALFRAGVREQQVHLLEGRAHLFVVLGRKA